MIGKILQYYIYNKGKDIFEPINKTDIKKGNIVIAKYINRNSQKICYSVINVISNSDECITYCEIQDNVKINI